MACNNIGSRVLEVISKADVGLKRKESLLKKLKGFYGALALDKFGSHVVDRFWYGARFPTEIYTRGVPLSFTPLLRLKREGM
jgi:hypothetical protein